MAGHDLCGCWRRRILGPMEHGEPVGSKACEFAGQSTPSKPDAEKMRSGSFRGPSLDVREAAWTDDGRRWTSSGGVTGERPSGFSAGQPPYGKITPESIRVQTVQTHVKSTAHMTSRVVAEARGRTARPARPAESARVRDAGQAAVALGSIPGTALRHGVDPMQASNVDTHMACASSCIQQLCTLLVKTTSPETKVLPDWIWEQRTCRAPGGIPDSVELRFGVKVPPPGAPRISQPAKPKEELPLLYLYI
ncbi:predicted protein [Coccidioides posadasii str. Silveira]|uniref:Predicted protein n=1 Tax=Coccidioides posadasii (strain RMSCC 757 / Silveira) TaxID=443226 RepID=E9DA52_COCPS|nr:predicted protein [Coccidioides posadasii str. Silveira]